MAYRRGQRSVREAYEEHFIPMDSREVTLHRVVNIVDKRNPMPRPGLDYDRGFYDDQWYDDLRNYHDGRGYHDEGHYPQNDRRYFDENPNYGNFRRNSSPPRNEGHYNQRNVNRDDLRHQLGSRNSGRAPHFRNRGRAPGPPHRKDHPSAGNVRDRSPGRREAQPVVVRSLTNTSNRNFSPDRDKGHAHQQKHKSIVVTTSNTPSSSAEGSPHSSGSSKEKASASVAESEEVTAASMEPKSTPEEDVKARRLEAIKAKALEIEKHYRQDCETFRTVVKMLVDKEPSLDTLLQSPLDKNLLEIKQRCLDGLRDFVKELDDLLEQPDTSA